MKENIVYQLLRRKQILVPSFLLEYRSILHIDYLEIVFLAFLMQKEEPIVFDIGTFADEMYISKDEVMNVISKLCEKNLLGMQVKKTENLMREYLDLSLFYERITLLCLKEEPKEDLTIYERIEKEFGRGLSPMECEMIKQWLDAKIDVKMILDALKETVLNGVTNLKYMDKILMEWSRKGYSSKKVIKKDNPQVEYFDYDWLSEDE